MKKSTIRRLLVLCLCLTLVTVSLIGGTLAKYTSTVEGTGTATVAKWAVKAGDSSGATTISNFVLEKATNDTGVADDKIAPGTSGVLPVYIDLNGTEVAAKVTVTIKVDDTDKLPNNFVMKNFSGEALTLQSGTEVEVFTQSLSAADAKTWKLQSGNNSKTDGANITWEWPFNGDDSTESSEDTTDGSAANIAAANFTVKVTVEQLDVDPTTPSN